MTMPPGFGRTPDGRLVAVPTPAPTPPPEPEEEVEDRFAAPQQEGFVPTPEPRVRDDLDELEVTDEDILGAEEDNLDQEADMSDLFEPPEEEDISDLFGEAPEQPRRPKPKRRLIRRTARPYYPPSQSIIGPR